MERRDFLKATAAALFSEQLNAENISEKLIDWVTLQTNKLREQGVKIEEKNMIDGIKKLSSQENASIILRAASGHQIKIVKENKKYNILVGLPKKEQINKI